MDFAKVKASKLSFKGGDPDKSAMHFFTFP